MNFRRIKNEFKEEVYKEDLVKVIKNGLPTAILYAVLLGALNYICVYLFKINLPFTLIVLGYVISGAVAKSYYNKHILYPILAVVFLIVALFFFNISYAIAEFRDFSLLSTCFSVGFERTINYFNLLYLITNPINFIINILVLIFTIHLTFQRSKNNYY